MAHCNVPDKLDMFSYLTQLYEAFRGEIPHIKHPKLVSNLLISVDCSLNVIHVGFFFVFVAVGFFCSWGNQEPEADERPLYDKQLAQLTSEKKALLVGRLAKHETAGRPRHSRSSRHNNENVQAIVDKKTDGSLGRRSRKRRSNEKMGASVVSSLFFLLPPSGE